MVQSGRTLAVDKMIVHKLGGSQVARPFFEAIAEHCDRMVWAGELARGEKGKSLGRSISSGIGNLIGNYRDPKRDGRRNNKLVKNKSGASPALPASVAEAAAEDDYLLAEACAYGAQIIVTLEQRVVNLHDDADCARWLAGHGIRILHPREYLTEIGRPDIEVSLPPAFWS